MAKTNTAQAVRSTDTPEQSNIGVFTTASAMAKLWNRASRDMNLHELEWFADGAARQVENEADALASVLMSTGCLVQTDEGQAGSFVDSESHANLIFNIQNQISTMAELASIAADAGYRARQVLKGGAA